MINKSQVQQENLNIIDNIDKSENDKNELIEKLKQLLLNVINSDNQLDTRALQDVVDIANTTSNNQGYELDKYKDLKINIDGYSDLNLEMFLNLGVADKDNVNVVY
jgi:hypothetical protein